MDDEWWQVARRCAALLLLALATASLPARATPARIARTVRGPGQSGFDDLEVDPSRALTLYAATRDGLLPSTGRPMAREAGPTSPAA